jgi:hypothetical protein
MFRVSLDTENSLRLNLKPDTFVPERKNLFLGALYITVSDPRFLKVVVLPVEGITTISVSRFILKMSII